MTVTWIRSVGLLTWSTAETHFQVTCYARPIPGKASEKLNDLLGGNSVDGAKEPKQGNTYARMRQGAGALIIDATGTALLTGSDRVAYVGAQYVDKGYMTNYAAGYHLVRTNPKTIYDANSDIVANGGTCITADGTAYDRDASGKFKELGGTAGPIQLSVIDKSRIPSVANRHSR